MKRRLLSGLVAFGFLSACGGEAKPPPEVPVDDSCGLDCDVQKVYGLMPGRCFEYSKTTAAQEFPELGLEVRPAEKIEGEMKAMPVEYRQNGQIKMTDYFIFKDGGLYLARRVWPGTGSVTYRDVTTGNIVGVPWLKSTSAANQNFDASVKADVNFNGQHTSDETTFRVNTLAPSTDEKKMAGGEFPDALKLVFTETPDHGKDSRRVIARGTGFVVFSSSFEQNPSSTAQPFFLQKVRELNDTAGGPVVDCGLTP